MTVKFLLAKLIRELQFYSPWRRHFFPKYDYNFTPPQLLYLCECLEKTRGLTGAVVEVGCSAGKTTVFLNNYLAASNISRSYFAIDTFEGFKGKDVEYEATVRDKPKNQYRGFRLNSQKWFDGTMNFNSLEKVVSIRTDINTFDIASLGEICFGLLDVDLYRPTKTALPQLYKVLAPGGIIVVDDCNPGSHRWDGARQAYREFAHDLQVPEQILHGKLGIIQKS